MKRGSLIEPFRHAATRPRAIIWTGTTLIVLAALAVSFVGILTSTRWFCAEICHHVQDDAIAAYNASSHSEISCIACHEPVNANVGQFVIAKAKSAAEIVPAVLNTFELPLNKGSAAALNPNEMGDKQCTQCHTTQRRLSPSPGIIIDHGVHAKSGVTCTTCHNRVAHNDAAITLTLEGDKKHADFMKMDACFRCHGLEGEHEAPGECAVCHTADFGLVPATHKAPGWLPSGHSEAAAESLKEYGAATVEAEALVREGIAERLVRPVEHCSTCHKAEYCKACHSKLASALPGTTTP